FYMSGNTKTLVNLSRGINSATAITDCLIGGSFTWYLRRSYTGIQRSDSVLNWLILFFIGTGLATAVSAILTLLLTLAYPTSLYSVIFYVNITRLYMNTLLAMLNFRPKI
ncbi:uncharacterized protein FOMMEDRAFT_32797, partial [Fomitiporia mediterranea MF3/22]|uniref:uncharacterized protein n=1 Tax=Fomitiporia mediterranea (strain MF3/22) TaxID=694068 RepID=UPI0004408D15